MVPAEQKRYARLTVLETAVVLVEDGILYCTAGRSMFLDGGLRFLKLDPATGRKLLELPYRRPDDELSAFELLDVVAVVRQRLATPVGGRR